MPLSPAESQLHAALAEYLQLVHSGRVGSAEPASAETLRSIFMSLETLETELSSQLDPRLRHFLESKSYRKAHDYLSALSSSGLANDSTPRQACSR